MKLFGFIASIFGATSQAADTKMVDAKEILFSTSTLNNALPTYQATQLPGQKLFQLPEDEWRQFEALSASNLPAIEQELTAIRKIHETATVKTKLGDHELTAFRSIHVRALITTPIVEGLRLSEVAALSDASATFTGFSLSDSPPAVGGYAFPVGGLVVYGQADGERVVSLCFSYSGDPRVPADKADKLAALIEDHQLLVVHWPSAMKIDATTQLAGFLKGETAADPQDSRIQTREAFERELKKRGISSTIDEASGRYRLRILDTDRLVSIENLQRDVDRDHDLSRVIHFVDTILSPITSDSTQMDVTQLYWCLEPSDYVEKPDIRKSVSDRVDRVLVLLSDDRSKITWVTPKMLERDNLPRETAEAAGFENLSRELQRAKIEFSEIDGVRLGFVGTTLPFKSSLILAPNLRQCVEATLGWPLLGVAPDRDFLYLWAAQHEKLVTRVGRVVVEEHAKASYPLSTEVYSITDQGVLAIGEFPSTVKAVK